MPVVNRVHQGGQIAAIGGDHCTALRSAAGFSDGGRFRARLRGERWFGVGAPKNTPAEIVDKLNKEINAILADPKIKAKFADLGGSVIAGSPADFGKLIVEETEKWAKVVRFSGAKVN